VCNQRHIHNNCKHTHTHVPRYTVLPCFACCFANQTRAELRKKYNLVEVTALKTLLSFIAVQPG